MNSAAKLVIGVLIFLAGIYWYWPGNSIATILGVSSNVRAFLTVFAGLFGLVLIFLGLIVAWIEYEDLKWESRERQEKKRKK